MSRQENKHMSIKRQRIQHDSEPPYVSNTYDNLPEEATFADPTSSPVLHPIHMWKRVATGPSYVIVSASGIWVLSGQIHRYDSTGNLVYKWGQSGKEKGEWDKPSVMAIKVEDKIDPSICQELHKVPEIANFPPGIEPLCAVYVGCECLYVADRGNHRIQVFDLAGGYVRSWGEKGTGPGQFDHPHSLCIGPNGLVYVTDQTRLQTFTDDGTLVSTHQMTTLRLLSGDRFHVLGGAEVLYTTHRLARETGIHDLTGKKYHRIKTDDWNTSVAGACVDPKRRLYLLYYKSRYGHLQRLQNDGWPESDWILELRSAPMSMDLRAMAISESGTLYIASMEGLEIFSLPHFE